ncbi:MAG: ATP-grasp domain-containing protein [Clostridia bacterium]|nr:ATP-grasp domain-containing protein [Clostridia bacterium]
MYEDLIGKKLLIIGSEKVDASIVTAAKSLGIYTIAVDGNKKSASTFAKNEADESWDIDYRLTDEICEKCRQAEVDGVIAGYSEYRVAAACEIANKLGKPFYATQKQIELTRNKRTFKDECIKYGINVPHDYCFNHAPFDEEIESMRFPLIVKPTDYGGRKGITVCFKKEELKNAVEYALSLSKSKTIIVEEYIIGKEFTAVYSLSNGEMALTCLNEKYINESQERMTGLCDLTIAPSKSVDLFVKSVDKKIKDFLRGIGAENGVAFFQGIEKDGEFYIFEMGYRLNGGNDYFLVEQEHGISYMKMLISYALTGKMGDDIKKNNPFFNSYHANYLIYAHEGTVKDIEYPKPGEIAGIDESTPNMVSGCKIKEDGSTGQKAFSFKITSNSLDQIKQTITQINRSVKFTDSQGNNMLFEPFDVNKIS